MIDPGEPPCLRIERGASLAKLVDLHDRETLSQQEYEQAKAKVLDGSAASLCRVRGPRAAGNLLRSGTSRAAMRRGDREHRHRTLGAACSVT